MSIGIRALLLSQGAAVIAGKGNDKVWPLKRCVGDFDKECIHVCLQLFSPTAPSHTDDTFWGLTLKFAIAQSWQLHSHTNRAKSRSGVTPKKSAIKRSCASSIQIPNLLLGKKCMPRLARTASSFWLVKQSLMCGLTLRAVNLYKFSWSGSSLSSILSVYGWTNICNCNLWSCLATQTDINTRKPLAWIPISPLAKV